MSAQHTPGRLTQGYTLATPQTRQWSGQQWEQNEAREKCLVFADFTSIDLGRSRKLVAQCHQGPEDARRLAACWNACEGLPTDLLENITMMGDTLHSRFRLREQTERELIAQRDALLAALQAFDAAMRECGGHPDCSTDRERLREAHEKAMAAIATAEKA